MGILASNTIDDFVEKAYPDMIAWRRKLHQMPETGWTEYVTTWYVYNFLAELGYTCFAGKEAVNSNERMGVPAAEFLEEAAERATEYGVPEDMLEKMDGGHTGVVAQLTTGRPGPHIALRFDIDGLPITESEEAGHKPYDKGFLSTREGFMHACGHDAHTAIGLTVARFLAEHKDELAGSFTLLFQPAEEGSRGAKAMVENGWLREVDAFLSGHIGIRNEKAGVMAARGVEFLATTKFDLRLHGVSAHAAAKPNEGRDALLAAAACAQTVAQIPPHPDGAIRAHIGTLQTGSGRNVVADTAFLEGETRGETSEVNKYVWKEVERRIHGAAEMHGVGAELKVVGEGVEAYCDTDFETWLETGSSASRWIERVDSEWPVQASEDAAIMINSVQQQGGIATYMLYGTALADGHHKPTFDYEEETLPVAAAALLHTISEYLHEKV
ncbi:amidohydrolase [Salsuginibacillus kocurii]|uniref:amidohydrolase n=1 Tax=Salsuginibacillus kocurii TaxID=427078 RepID=UPI00036094F4|nr:amidohydrolase [Salsuginibacillus kocurii]